MTLLTKAEIAKERLDAMCRVFQRGDRVLVGDHRLKVEVLSQGSNPAPAWSDGETITFNRDQVGTVTSFQDLIKLTGLNFHEMAHILFTPRQSTQLVQGVISRNEFWAFNALEDQRIETLLTAMYPSVEPYLVTTFMRYCAANPDQYSGNFIISHGRRFLPVEVRMEFEKQFDQPDLIDDFKRVIDSYRDLVFPGAHDEAQAAKLITEYQRLMTQNRVDPPNDPYGHADGQRPIVQKGQMKDAKAQGKAQRARPDEDAEDEEALDAASGEGDGDEGEDGDDTGNGSGTDTDGEGDGEGQNSGDDADGGGKAQGESDKDGKPSPGKSAGKGTGTWTPGADPLDDDSLRDMLNGIADQIDNSAAVQADIRAKQKSIVEGDGDVTLDINRSKGTLRQAGADDILTARKFGQELQRMEIDMDPGWYRHRPSGKVNIQRAMQGADLDSVFDVWDSGVQDATDIEAVILIDTSGSMQHEMDTASRALWVIGKALDDVKATSTVIAFADGAAILRGRGEKVERGQYERHSAYGGTHAASSIKAAMKIFHNSNRSKKLLFVITDGEWWDASTADDLIVRIRNAGIVTALAYIGEHDDRWGPLDTHNCQHAATVRSPIDLIPMARTIVKGMVAGQGSSKVKRQRNA